MENNEEQLLTGLDPIVCPNSRLLVLGSMPGARSLETGQYYAFAQNRFWHIIFELCGRPYTSDYEVKKALLRQCRIALWDSIGSCYRTGSSLDSKIKAAKANDITAFLAAHPSIEHVITNGRASEKYLKRYNPDVRHIYLPSTSPANAKIKNVREQWLSALRTLLN